MNTGSYPFKLGDFECVSLSDGSLDYALQSLFANVPLERVEQALRQRDLPTDYITTPYTCLYVDTGAQRVLVDMGAGHLGPRTGKLVENMGAAGISPSEIDTVVITHAHPDHIGGTLDDGGRPVYANTHYFFSREEWAFWFSEEAMEKTPEMFVSVARQNLAPIRDRVTLLHGESEIVPGVRAIPAPGHTPGHSVVQFASGDQRLYYIGDTALNSLHLEHPDWLTVYDILPEKAVASKRAIFDRKSKLTAISHLSYILTTGHHIPSLAQKSGGGNSDTF